MRHVRGGLLAAVLCIAGVYGQGPGRGGAPGATEAQTAALGRMNAELAKPLEAAGAARTAMIAAAFAEPGNARDLSAKAESLRAAELALAQARAEAFATLQASPGKLAANQVAALAASAGGGGRGAALAHGSIPNITEAQVTALTRLTTDVMPLTKNVASARTALGAAALTESPDPAALRAKADAVAAA